MPVKKKTKSAASKATKKPKKKVAAKPVKKPTTKKTAKGVSKKTPSTTKKTSTKAETAEERYLRLRRDLIQKREQIVAEAKNEIKNYITGENRQLVEAALDEGDWSVIDLSEDISLRKLTTHRQSLLKIDEALRKLDEGTYGICEDCGEEIAPERLKLLPYAIFCRDCQEKHEMLEAVERAEE